MASLRRLPARLLQQGLMRAPVSIAQPLRPLLLAQLPLQVSSAPFTTSTPLLKKSKAPPPPPPSKNGSGSSKSHYPEPNSENPLDLSDITARYNALDTEYRDRLKKSTSKGRIGPEVLGRVPVKLTVTIMAPAPAPKPPKVSRKNKAGAEAPPEKLRREELVPTQVVQTFPLSELAQVVDGRGGLVRILVNEQQFVKPIMSAIQNSEEYNQQPQKGETDLELLMRTELVLPEDQMRQVGEAAERWKTKIRDARTNREKVHKAWQKERIVLADTTKKVEKQLALMQEKELSKIDRLKEEIVRSIKATQL